MLSRHSGQCPRCGAYFDKGTEIVRCDGAWMHDECPVKPELPRREERVLQSKGWQPAGPKVEFVEDENGDVVKITVDR